MEFEEYVKKFEPQIADIRATLNESLSENPAELKAQLIKAESKYSLTMGHLAWANCFLDLAISKKMPPKGELTENERKAITDAGVANERKFRNIIEGTAESIKQRVSLGQSLLRTLFEETSYQQP